MKLTQEVIDKIQEAMLHKKKDGSINWKDTDEIEVQLAGTFAADKCGRPCGASRRSMFVSRTYPACAT